MKEWSHKDLMDQVSNPERKSFARGLAVALPLAIAAWAVAFWMF